MDQTCLKSLEFPFLKHGQLSKPDTHRADYQLELVRGQKLEQPPVTPMGPAM